MTESTVFVIDDAPEIRGLIRKMLETANLKVSTYASAAEFLLTYSPEHRGCLLLDINMPGMDGLELLEELTSLGNRTPVIFLTGVGTVEKAVTALKSGAVDFIEKPVVMDELLTCVRRAIDMDRRRNEEMLESMQINKRFEQLTARENEVLSWVVQGKSNKMIGKLLGISSRTVEVHRGHVIEKMQADSTADLIKMGLKVMT